MGQCKCTFRHLTNADRPHACLVNKSMLGISACCEAPLHFAFRQWCKCTFRHLTMADRPQACLVNKSMLGISACCQAPLHFAFRQCPTGALPRTGCGRLGVCFYCVGVKLFEPLLTEK